jgi:hypothetical protein
MTEKEAYKAGNETDGNMEHSCWTGGQYIPFLRPFYYTFDVIFILCYGANSSLL